MTDREFADRLCSVLEAVGIRVPTHSWPAVKNLAERAIADVRTDALIECMGMVADELDLRSTSRALTVSEAVVAIRRAAARMVQEFGKS